MATLVATAPLRRENCAALAAGGAGVVNVVPGYRRDAAPNSPPPARRTRSAIADRPATPFPVLARGLGFQDTPGLATLAAEGDRGWVLTHALRPPRLLPPLKATEPVFVRFRDTHQRTDVLAVLLHGGENLV